MNPNTELIMQYNQVLELLNHIPTTLERMDLGIHKFEELKEDLKKDYSKTYKQAADGLCKLARTLFKEIIPEQEGDSKKVLGIIGYSLLAYSHVLEAASPDEVSPSYCKGMAEMDLAQVSKKMRTCITLPGNGGEVCKAYPLQKIVHELGLLIENQYGVEVEKLRDACYEGT